MALPVDRVTSKSLTVGWGCWAVSFGEQLLQIQPRGEKLKTGYCLGVVVGVEGSLSPGVPSQL